MARKHPPNHRRAPRGPRPKRPATIKTVLNGTFVRGLWQTPRPRWGKKVCPDMASAVRFHGQAVYSFGDASRQILFRHNYHPIALEPDETCRRHGCSPWRHKLLAIRKSLETETAIVWLDWDVSLVNGPLPDNFWGIMAAGAPIQCKLRQYRNVRAPWRDADRRKCVSAAFIYLRSVDLADELLRIHAEHYKWDDEITIIRLIDTLIGPKWLGAESYLALGYDPPVYTIGDEIHPSPFPVFTAR